MPDIRLLFVCLAMKPIHLKIVTSLSTPDLNACIRRFIARRGLQSGFFPCLNSRPLCQLSIEPKDSNTLTTGHFLTRAPLLAVPDDCTNNMPGHMKCWELVEKLVHTF